MYETRASPQTSCIVADDGTVACQPVQESYSWFMHDYEAWKAMSWVAMTPVADLCMNLTADSWSLKGLPRPLV